MLPNSRLTTHNSQLPVAPDVSIIVVAHNDEADLPVSVGSALAQRGVVTETLVVDNDSGDGSREVVRRVAGNGARLLYRPLLAAGMLLRLAALPFRRTVPRPRREAARAYLATLAVALFEKP